MLALFYIYMWQLTPFYPSKYQVAATVKLFTNELSLEFSISTLTLPSISKTVTLTCGHELWKDNCVEFFWQDDTTTGYYELNLSLAGQWNIYQFDSYRQGMRDITDQFVGIVQYQQNGSQVFTRLTFIPPAANITQFQLAAIIYNHDSPHYFALKHAKHKPDFHQPSAFISSKKLQIKQHST